jgi:aspartyl-tRNA(Asn)/glutamyl-tRNA(Gln) amidotransferase subunit C
MAITKKDVEHVARLARIALSEDEIKNFTTQLAAIVDYVDQLKKVDTSSVEPLAQPVPLENVERQDVVRGSGADEKILSIAPEREGRFFKVHKVIE